MEYIEVIANALPLIAVGIFALIVRKYLPSYLSKKGENLATKEDIGAITNIVEAIRVQRSTELEILKTAFQHTASERSALTGDQRAAVSQFLDSCIDLIGKLQINLGDLPIDDGVSLMEYQKAVAAILVDLLKQYYRMSVYLEPNSDIVKAATTFVTNAWRFRNGFSRPFGRLKMALIEEDAAVKQADKTRYASAVKATNEKSEAYYAAIRPFFKGMEETLPLLLSAINKQFRGDVEGGGFEALTAILKAGVQDFEPISHRREP